MILHSYSLTFLKHEGLRTPRPDLAQGFVLKGNTNLLILFLSHRIVQCLWRCIFFLKREIRQKTEFVMSVGYKISSCSVECGCRIVYILALLTGLKIEFQSPLDASIHTEIV